MKEPIEDVDVVWTAHELVLPPTNLADAKTIPNNAKSRMHLFLEQARQNHNDNLEDNARPLRFTEFMREIVGIDTHAMKPIWCPNNFIDRGQFVEFYVAVIKSVKGGSFVILPSIKALQDAMLRQRVECERALVNATREARELIKETVRIAQRTPARPEGGDSGSEVEEGSEYSVDDDTVYAESDIDLYEGLVSIDELIEQQQALGAIVEGETDAEDEYKYVLQKALLFMQNFVNIKWRSKLFARLIETKIYKILAISIMKFSEIFVNVN